MTDAAHGLESALELWTERGRATIGVVRPGHYSFDTAEIQAVTVTSGRLELQIDEGPWRTLLPGEELVVLPGRHLSLRASADASDVCFYDPI